ncbi:MAG: aminotransferase class III-fold pyridoxal phosphate-dependent enzyme, partial [Propionibacteriales bacterium]|nr:aminotransferase class III-fold pyridoxal phosphate-dependent enzyme [Propionibacteriales bacterium]
GVIVPPADYLAGAREITRAHGALLWIDEVQTGIGRTGDWLAHRPGGEGIVADIVTVAKGLGNGFPIGACLATGRAADLLQPGAHGTTFGGNPVAAMAGLAVLTAISRDGLLEHVTATGDAFTQQIRDLGHPVIAEVRGKGFLLGIELTDERAAAVSDLALDAGFVINAPRPNVLRLAPPLITTTEHLATFTAALSGLLDAAAPAGSAGDSA